MQYFLFSLYYQGVVYSHTALLNDAQTALVIYFICLDRHI